MKSSTKAWIGVLAWTGFLAAARTGPSGGGWGYVLLLFAALVLVPVALDLAAERRDTGRIGSAMLWARALQLPAAALLAISCGMPQGFWALLVAIPWAAFTALLASAGLGRLLRDSWSRPIDRLSADVGMGYLVIGGLWVLADRGGVRPTGFDATVVALTAVHFHYAGFLLPLLSGQAVRHAPDSRFAARGIVGIVLGVPAVAVGVTASQIGWSPAIEAAAGCGLALGAMVIAILTVRWALETQEAGAAARTLVGASGVSLFFAMVLAALYAVRAFAVPFEWLGLAKMRALHGTLLAFGFGLCGVVGWTRARYATLRAADGR